MSFIVETPKITEVMDMTSGKVISAKDLIGNEFDKTIILRSKLAQGILKNAPLYTCALCGVGVRLNRMYSAAKFYFRHILEDGRCPIETSGNLTRKEINAISYNGAKESKLHIQMKEWIREGLERDPSFTGVEVEKKWKGALTSKYRRPDVRANYLGLPIAFEIQLSSTYLDIIVERREFYMQEGALLFWIFASFDDEMRKLTQDDVFYNNNQNAFVVSYETVLASLKQSRFMFECIWREPKGGKTVSDLKKQIISFAELSLDQKGQQAYFYDFYGEREKISLKEAEILKKDNFLKFQERQRKIKSELRNTLETQWFNWVEYGEYDKDEWLYLVEELDEFDYKLPQHPSGLPRTVLNSLFSLKYGEPFGWNKKTLTEVAHMVLSGNASSHQSSYLKYFWKAIKVYERKTIIELNDKNGKWSKKIREHRTQLKNGIIPSKGNKEYHKLITFIFPKLDIDVVN